jgi:hypothetical protein
MSQRLVNEQGCSVYEYRNPCSDYEHICRQHLKPILEWVLATDTDLADAELHLMQSVGMLFCEERLNRQYNWRKDDTKNT